MKKNNMDNREREERECRAAEIEARRQATQQRIEDRQRRAREKYGEEKGQRDALKQENQFKGDNKDRVI